MLAALRVAGHPGATRRPFCSVSGCAHGDSLRLICRYDAAFRSGARGSRSGFDVRRDALVAGYVAVPMAVSLLTPQKIGSAGHAYCKDIWCIGIEKVSPMPARNEIAYKVDVRIFSDANTVKTSGKGFSLFLVDERGRRFPMVKDPSAIPFDLSLDPGQSVNN
jgi:hypothetical protein